VTPKPTLEALKKSRPRDIAVRFAFGGSISVLAGLVAKYWGPIVGGLLLAFPAILPASLTLVKQHDGRAKAVDDARGGRLGSAGLIAFAATVWAASATWRPTIVLIVATLVWAVVGGTCWAIRYGRQQR
jgi:hypothetical protein